MTFCIYLLIGDDNLVKKSGNNVCSIKMLKNQNNKIKIISLNCSYFLNNCGL